MLTRIPQPPAHRRGKRNQQNNFAETLQNRTYFWLYDTFYGRDDLALPRNETCIPRYLQQEFGVQFKTLCVHYGISVPKGVKQRGVGDKYDLKMHEKPISITNE